MMNRTILFATALLMTASFLVTERSALAQEAFMGEIRMFGSNYCPAGWLAADGQLLPISQYTALFSLFGPMYGGDGRTTFALPDLRGRAPIHHGTGPGLSSYQQGQRGGQERVSLTVSEIPSHSHRAEEVITRSGRGRGINLVTTEQGGENTIGVSLEEMRIEPSGGSQPHYNMSPYLVMNYCVNTGGTYPTRN